MGLITLVTSHQYNNNTHLMALYPGLPGEPVPKR